MTSRRGPGSPVGTYGGASQREKTRSGRGPKQGRRADQRRQTKQRDPADAKAERFFLLATKLLDMSAEATRRDDPAEAERRRQEALSVAEKMPEGRSAHRLKNGILQRARQVEQAGRVKKAPIAKDVPKPDLSAQPKRTRNTAKKPARVLVRGQMKKVQCCSVCGIADPSLPKLKKDRVCGPCRREQRGVFLLQAGSPGLGRRGR